MLITSVITACSCNTLKPKALPRRARGKNRTKSSSLLLHLAKQAEPQSEAVSAKWGAMSLHQVVTLPTLFCSSLPIELVFLFEPFIGLTISIFLNKCSDVGCTIIGLMAYRKVRKFATCPIPLQGSERYFQQESQILIVEYLIVFVQYLVGIDKGFQVLPDFGELF